MNKDFVPYDQALALKALGFDEPCFAKFFTPEVPANRFRYNTQGSPVNYNDGTYGRQISAPLFQQAFRWFREKHDLRHQIEYVGGLTLKTTWWDFSIIGKTDGKKLTMKYKTWEETEIACLIALIDILKGS